MLISSSIVKVQPDKAGEVLELLGQIPKVTTFGIHQDTNIIVVTEAHDVKQLEKLNAYILEQIPDALGIFPTYLADEEKAMPEGD